MLQQITIQSRTSKPLKPLVEVAIRKQLTSLRHGIARTRQQLAAFENRFGMSTAEMEQRLQTGELSETLATIDWCMELAALRLLEEQYTALNEARLIEDYFKSLLDLLTPLPSVENPQTI